MLYEIGIGKCIEKKHLKMRNQFFWKNLVNFTNVNKNFKIKYLYQSFLFNFFFH